MIVMTQSNQFFSNLHCNFLNRTLAVSNNISSQQLYSGTPPLLQTLSDFFRPSHSSTINPISLSLQSNSATSIPILLGLLGSETNSPLIYHLCPPKKNGVSTHSTPPKSNHPNLRRIPCLLQSRSRNPGIRPTPPHRHFSAGPGSHDFEQCPHHGHRVGHVCVLLSTDVLLHRYFAGLFGLCGFGGWLCLLEGRDAG